MLQNIEIPGLIRLLDASPTAFHAADHIANQLKTAGFEELDEKETWRLDAGQNYFVRRNLATLFAFRTPQRMTERSAIRLISAHTDSPALRLKPNSSVFRDGMHLLDVEVYGSPLLNSWLDRDLGYAGLVIYRRRGEAGLHTRLIRSSNILRIPQLAVHLDREVNKQGLKLNPQHHLMPILGIGGGDTPFPYLLESYLDNGDELVDYDLQLFDTQAASFAGLDKEFLLSGRIDNLAMAHAGIRALLDAPGHTEDVQGVFLFHNEECGSQSLQGAESDFARNCLQRIGWAFKISGDAQLAWFARSFGISADMAHAVHPLYEDRHDPVHRPRLNGGPVIKSNAQRRYATEAITSARFREYCRLAGIVPQVYSCHNDIPCGSTVGPGLSARLGIPTVDVGNPMLSMHSIREMAGSSDHDAMIKVLKTSFQAD